MKTTLETFKGFPQNARTWVYQASRTLTDQESGELLQLAKQFTGNWMSHGAKLPGAADVLYNRFLIMMVDESEETAGGCSIDGSVQHIRIIQSKLNVNMLDRLNLAYVNSDDVLETVHANKIAEAFEHGALSEETTVFNNMVTSKNELETAWRIPLIESWASDRLKVV